MYRIQGDLCRQVIYTQGTEVLCRRKQTSHTTQWHFTATVIRHFFLVPTVVGCAKLGNSHFESDLLNLIAGVSISRGPLLIKEPLKRSKCDR